MPSWDHVIDAVNDFAFMNARASSDPERDELNSRRRVATVLWIPGALLIAFAAGSMRSWLIAIAGMVVLVAALWLFSERPRFLFRR